MAGKDLVNSLLKGLDIISLVGSSEKGLRLSEIAEELKMKRPAAHNLVRTLLSRSFLEKRGGMYLFVGPALLELLKKRKTSMLMSEAGNELMRLCKILPSGLIFFAEATADGIHQVLRMGMDRPGIIQRITSEPMHSYGSATGLIRLAFADENSLLQIEESRPFAEFGAHLWKSRNTLDKFLRAVRKNKVSLLPFENEIFLRIAAPVFGESGTLLGAFGASIPLKNINKGMDKKNIIKELKHSAERLSALYRNKK
ncbi:MAG TPA: helix-turn-helix domain-containing protein [Victivallales bacterium]|nr:helix-turn-helix domain-containing protein [Victivallales bacterium]